MPRPKGSKNKKSASVPAAGITVEEMERKIAAAEAEIEELGASLKTKKAELKGLVKEKKAALAAAAEKKAAEDKQAILDAVEKSGKSVEEILELLK